MTEQEGKGIGRFGKVVIDAFKRQAGHKPEVIILELPQRPQTVPETRGQPIIEPATGEYKKILEANCEEILSRETIYSHDFDSYVNCMIKILGSGGRFRNPRGRDSRPIQRLEEESQYSVMAEFKQDEDGKYQITTQYTSYGENNDMPTAEIVQLTANPDEIDDESFSEVYFSLVNTEFSAQFFKSLTSDEPIPLEMPYEQEKVLSMQETLDYMRKTFEIYKTWRDQTDVFEYNVEGGKYVVDYHQKEYGNVWNFIPNESPSEPTPQDH